MPSGQLYFSLGGCCGSGQWLQVTGSSLRTTSQHPIQQGATGLTANGGVWGRGLWSPVRSCGQGLDGCPTGGQRLRALRQEPSLPIVRSMPPLGTSSAQVGATSPRSGRADGGACALTPLRREQSYPQVLGPARLLLSFEKKRDGQDTKGGCRHLCGVPGSQDQSGGVRSQGGQAVLP